MNITAFLREYKEKIKQSNPSIIRDITDLNIIGKENKVTLTLKEGKEAIFNHIRLNSSYKGEWMLVNSQEKRNWNPEFFSLKNTIIFSVDIAKSKVSSSIIAPLGNYWFLVKMSPYFEIRNTKMLLQKFENKEFSRVDKILLGDKTLSEGAVFTKTYTNNALDEHQNQALTEAMNSQDVSIIKGPPGTGKTFTITKIIEECLKEGERVIFASSLHSSLDSLIQKMNSDKYFDNVKIWRSSIKDGSVHPKVSTENIWEARVFVTTFASYALNASLKEKNMVLMIDEASANNLFDVFSKTIFAKRVIVVGDNAQLYPIYSPIYQRYMENMYKKEFKFFFINSLFDNLYKINKSKMITLLNNYRSEKSIVDVVNFFYQNKLKYNKENETDNHIEFKQFDSLYKLKDEVMNFRTEHQDGDVLYISYYKDVIEILNKGVKKDRFKTSASVQGIESDTVVIVLSMKNPSIYKHQLDYRIINVALSRARKKIFIYYTNDLINQNMIKKDENDAEYFKFGELYSLEKAIKEQSSFNSKMNKLLNKKGK